MGYIHGIGITSAQKIIKIAKIDSKKGTNDLSTEDTILLRQAIENPVLELTLEGDLRRFNGLNIKRLNEINCYRGRRHRASLPTRGQRTRTNARARRGSKKNCYKQEKIIIILFKLLLL